MQRVEFSAEKSLRKSGRTYNMKTKECKNTKSTLHDKDNISGRRPELCVNISHLVAEGTRACNNLKYLTQHKKHVTSRMEALSSWIRVHLQ
jgi:hypothetical protein